MSTIMSSLTVFVVLLLVGSTSAFLCYNCTSFQQQSSCGEKEPLTQYLATTRCSTNCYKWILFSRGNEVRRGCKTPGMRPPVNSYAEYLCNQSLCNTATSVSVSKSVYGAAFLVTVIAMLRSC